MENQQVKIKYFQILFFGSHQTGKSLILKQFEKNMSQPKHIGVDFYAKEIEIGKEKIKILFWDFHSDEMFALSQFWSTSFNFILLIYDIAERNSFEEASKWFQYFKKEKQSKSILLVLVGNKCDLEDQRQVSYEEGQQLAKSMGMHFLEVSALIQKNIAELFQYLETRTINLF